MPSLSCFSGSYMTNSELSEGRSKASQSESDGARVAYSQSPISTEATRYVISNPLPSKGPMGLPRFDGHGLGGSSNRNPNLNKYSAPKKLTSFVLSIITPGPDNGIVPSSKPKGNIILTKSFGSIPVQNIHPGKSPRRACGLRLFGDGEMAFSDSRSRSGLFSFHVVTEQHILVADIEFAIGDDRVCPGRLLCAVGLLEATALKVFFTVRFNE